LAGNFRFNMVRQTFPQMFDNVVLRFGDRRCQWWKSGSESTASLTYDQVGRIVSEMSAGLMSLDLQKQDRAAIMSSNSPQWLWADFSILNAGGVTVSLYPTLSQREMAAMINDSGAKVLYVQDHGNLQKALNLWDDMPSLGKIILLQDRFAGDNPNVIGLDELRERGALFLARYSFAYEERWRSVDLFDRMTIIYTSGTTGEQKGAVHTHLSMNAACALDLKSMPPLSEEDVFLSILPLAHSYERQCGQMIALTVGATIAYAERPTTLMEDLQIFRPTTFMATPQYFETIFTAIKDAFSATPEDALAWQKALQVSLKVTEARADQHGFIDMSEGIDFSSQLHPGLRKQYLEVDAQFFARARALLGGNYRFAFSAAGALPAKLCKSLMAMGIRVIEGYGLIETCNTITLNPLHRILPGSMGPLASGMESRLADDGELLVRGSNVIKEYWNNHELIDEAMTSDGFFRTGDIVQELADGYLKIIDRKKGLLILNSGEKVPTAKLESAFFLNQYIDQICVVGDDRSFVAALVVPRFNLFLEKFRREDINFDENALQHYGEMCIKVGPDFIANQMLTTIVDQEIARINSTLEVDEQIRKYVIVNRRFTELADEVTPTMKLKRKVICSNFADEIDKLYEDALDTEE
jgi:long-chain acyl-CoA synthetase